MVAMVTILFTVYCKLFHMMPYIIILKVRKFHQTTASRFSTARKKPVGGHIVPPPSLNRVKYFLRYFKRLNKSTQSTLPTLLLKNLEELKIFFLGPKCKFFHMEESAEFQFRTMYLQIDVTLTESLLKSFMKSSHKMLSNFSKDVHGRKKLTTDFFQTF